MTGPEMSKLIHIVDHPLVQHKLTLMRRQETSTANFRRLMKEIAVLMAYEVTRDLPLDTIRVETPLAIMDAPILSSKKLCLVPILRAGSGMLDGMLDIIPSARVGHIGLYREPTTLEAIEYYFKTPDDIADRLAVVLDALLATGNTAIAAIDRLKDRGVTQLKFVCLLASPEGVTKLHSAHPDVPIYAASVDSHLDEHGYIVPGLGDVGNRLFGTK